MQDALKGKPAIKLLAMDVDGVLTDGGMYFGLDGQVMKRFNVKDGYGLAQLRDSGVKTAFITADSSEICRVRGEILRITEVCIHISDKAAALQEIMAKHNVAGDSVAYIGDDVPDLKVRDLVAAFACPADAAQAVQAVSDYVCRAPGGQGCVREVCEAILVHNAALDQEHV